LLASLFGVEYAAPRYKEVMMRWMSPALIVLAFIPASLAADPFERPNYGTYQRVLLLGGYAYYPGSEPEGQVDSIDELMALTGTRVLAKTVKDPGGRDFGQDLARFWCRAASR
jgi:hypothetical protein